MRHLFLISFLLALPLAGGVKPAKERPFIADMRARAKRGQARAQFDLGVSYRFGQGVPQSDEEAVKWYRMAAEQGYAKAEYNLGVCYDNGKGVSKDYGEAVTWYRKAAVQGHAKAQFNLGVSYKYGQGVRQDYVESYAWLSLSAAGGETIAARSLEDVVSNLSPQELERARLRERKLGEELLALQPKPRPGGRRGKQGKSGA